MQLPSLLMKVAVTSAHIISKILGISFRSVSSLTMMSAWFIFKNKYLTIVALVSLFVVLPLYLIFS